MRPAWAAGLVLLASAALAHIVRESEGSEGSGENRPPHELGAGHPHIVESASFAVSELRLLSESGIYETLELVRVHYGAAQVGTFHNNTYLTLELASPYLLDAKTTLHDVIVMKDLDDGVRSFAIDEFPVMEEDAIERFWIERVERER